MIYAEVEQDGILHQVWRGIDDPGFSPPLLPGSRLMSWPDGIDVRPGMIWDGSRLLPPPPPPVEVVRSHALQTLAEQARQTRAAVAGTDDPAKLAEYADKAALAPQIIAGTAPADAMAATREEALDLGLQDIPSGDTAEVQLARIWEQKAADLRAARNVINRIERTARAAIQAAQTADEVNTALADAQSQLKAMVASGGA